jgi:hypothetical protein
MPEQPGPPEIPGYAAVPERLGQLLVLKNGEIHHTGMIPDTDAVVDHGEHSGWVRLTR